MGGRTSTPEAPTIELSGKTGPQIAAMISAGEITQDDAETFVAQRAVKKLRKALSSISES